MTMYNINEDLKKAETDYGFGKSESNWFKIAEGDNRIRIASQPAVIAEHFKLGTCYGLDKGCKMRDEKENHPNPGVKWLCHVIDRKDNEIKLAKLPYSIIKDIGALQVEPGYEFDGMPMPYDINIKAKKAGTKEVEYTVIGSAKRSIIAPDEQIALDKQKTPVDIVQAFKDKQMKKDGVMGEKPDPMERVEYPEGPKAEDIPF